MNNTPFTLCLQVNEDLTSEKKVQIAELLTHWVSESLQVIPIIGIDSNGAKASQAFQIEINYIDRGVGIRLNPKNHFFYTEVNKIKNLDKLIKISELSFGMFFKIALKSFAMASPQMEDLIFNYSRKFAAEHLIRTNLHLISSMINHSIHTTLVPMLENRNYSSPKIGL